MTDWLLTTVTAVADITPSARTLRLRLDTDLHVLPGQHIDIRLTAEDGYSTARAYSVSDTREPRSIEVTVERVDDGEVSPYFVRCGGGRGSAGDQRTARMVVHLGVRR